MTWGETWMAILDGDARIIAATLIECAILASPFAILFGAWYAQS
jgi:hypothetical protein